LRSGVPQASGVVEMMVGSNNGTHLLTWDQGIGRQKDLLCVSVEHRAFDEHDLILHFDGDTVMRRTFEKPDPVHDLLRRLALLKDINTRVATAAGVSPDDMLITLYEVPGENISFGQGEAQRANAVARA
jgi:hypothetical protein